MSETNYLTVSGAEKLAKSIREFWWAKGKSTADIWTIADGTYPAVRSNLVNGLPPEDNIVPHGNSDSA